MELLPRAIICEVFGDDFQKWEADYYTKGPY